MAIAPNTDQQVGAMLEALRQAAPQLTETAIRYIHVQAIVTAIASVAVGIAVALWFRALLRWKIAEGDGNAEFGRVAGIVVCVVAATFSFFTFIDALPAVLSPEGAALFRLLP